MELQPQETIDSAPSEDDTDTASLVPVANRQNPVNEHITLSSIMYLVLCLPFFAGHNCFRSGLDGILLRGQQAQNKHTGAVVHTRQSTAQFPSRK